MMDAYFLLCHPPPIDKNVIPSRTICLLHVCPYKHFLCIKVEHMKLTHYELGGVK